MAPSLKRGNTKRYFEAAIAGNLKLIKKLAKELDNGQGLNKTFASIKDDKDRTALHLAAANGRCELCDYLVVTLKLDANVRDQDGYTPVHHAALGGHYCTVMDLVKFADPSATAANGCTPLHFAAAIGDVDIMRLLISERAKIESMAESGTALHKAAANGQKDAVKLLLICKANPNLATRHLLTPLLLSIVAESLECLELLLKDGGADPNMGACSLLPLELAANRRKVKIVKCLLEHGANPNAGGYSGLTPLEYVALGRDREMMEILFPLTTRIEYYPEWSISGIEDHINSSDIRKQRVSKCVQLRKDQGKQAFQRKDYTNAIFWYTEAINMSPSDETLFSNRSLCWVRLNEGDKALSDASKCIELKHDWSKAHYRAGAALKILQEYEYAEKAFAEALRLDPNNKETENELKEVLKMLALKK